eukprot:scaffold2065_cov39-Attheya_sp.AAC.2
MELCWSLTIPPRTPLMFSHVFTELPNRAVKTEICCASVWAWWLSLILLKQTKRIQKNTNKSIPGVSCGIQQGHEAREKDGFARVVEAVQGTVWSSAIMHAQQKQETRPQQQQQQQHEGDVIATGSNNEYEPPPTSLPVISDEESKAREAKARTTLLQEGGIIKGENGNNGLATDYIDDGTAAATKDNDLLLKNDKQAEKIMSDMESALSEANRIRDMSKAGELSNGDRRQRAADAAMLLMNLMTQMGDDDDEENDNSDDDDNDDSGNE